MSDRPSSASDGPVVLGIETSCDETGVGIVVGGHLRANTLASSAPEHARYGGIVPEVASRAHLADLLPTVERACAEAGMPRTCQISLRLSSTERWRKMEGSCAR